MGCSWISSRSLDPERDVSDLGIFHAEDPSVRVDPHVARPSTTLEP
jgi:hypothetical protein